MTNRIFSEIRGAGLISPVATKEYRALVPQQPLILTREPSNRVDPNAIIVKTVMGQPCGYLARQQAAIVAPQMDRGELWLAKCTGGGSVGRWATCLLWKERGSERKFKEAARAYGASETQILAVMQKKFLKEDAE